METLRVDLRTRTKERARRRECDLRFYIARLYRDVQMNYTRIEAIWSSRECGRDKSLAFHLLNG